jgi:hypothetical protein
MGKRRDIQRMNACDTYNGNQASFRLLYFFIKNKTFEINPFDKTSIKEHAENILIEARKNALSYKMFQEAVTKATGLNRRSIDLILARGLKRINALKDSNNQQIKEN